MARHTLSTASLVRRLQALDGTDADPFRYQQAQISNVRFVRLVARALAIAEAGRQCRTFDTRCLVCSASMIAERASKRTCSARCRQRCPASAAHYRAKGTNEHAAWWRRVVAARTKRDDLRPQRVCALRKDGHEAVVDVKAVPRHRRGDRAHGGRGLRKTRVFRSREQGNWSARLLTRARAHCGRPPRGSTASPTTRWRRSRPPSAGLTCRAIK